MLNLAAHKVTAEFGRLTKHTNLIHLARTAKSLYYQLAIKFLNHLEMWHSGGMAPIILNAGTHTGGQPHGPAIFIHSKEPPAYYGQKIWWVVSGVWQKRNKPCPCRKPNQDFSVVQSVARTVTVQTALSRRCKIQEIRSI